MIQWRLKKGHDKRLRDGHPWVFSNELAMSPKGVPPGGPVAIYDWDGQLMAFGYGNPHSLIAARILSFSPRDEKCVSPDFVREKLLSAWTRRKNWNFQFSSRLCFGEGDLLPGLIIDRYVIRNPDELHPHGQVFAVQMTTAGMDQILKDSLQFFKTLTEEAKGLGLHEFSWEQTAVVLRNDTGSRELEGLKKEEPQVVKSIPGVVLSKAQLAVAGLDRDLKEIPVWLSCDLIDGQKTGFFLDQVRNIHDVIRLLDRNKSLPNQIRILDLCCYVGHWSTQLTAYLKSRGCSVTADVIDVSAAALERAASNVRQLGGEAHAHRIDVFEKDFSVEARAYDIVIADPPALIKSRKAIPQGEHGYVKINQKSMNHVKSGGILVTCSCSGLLSEESFTDCVRKAFKKAARRALLVGRGGHSLDHPQRPEFPEGTYLKAHIYQMESKQH